MDIKKKKEEKRKKKEGKKNVSDICEIVGRCFFFFFSFPFGKYDRRFFVDNVESAFFSFSSKSILLLLSNEQLQISIFLSSIRFNPDFESFLTNDREILAMMVYPNFSSGKKGRRKK